MEPPRNASKAEKELAAAVDEWLHGIPDMEDIILNGMSSVGYGFSCQEISWAFVDKTWLPDAVTLRPHNWFITLPEHNDELRLDDGNCGEDGKDGSALWPFGWLVHRYNAGRGSRVHPACSAYWSGRICLKTLRCVIWRNFWRFTVFRRALPTMHRAPVMLTGTTFSKPRSIWAMKRWQHSLRVTRLNSRRPPPAAGVHVDGGMGGAYHLKSDLGSTLTSQADGKSSTNALGNVHNEVRHDILTADARQLSGMFSSLIQMMASLNGWQDIPPRRLPRLVFDVQQEADIKSVAEAVSVLVNNVGMKDIPVSWVRQKPVFPPRKTAKRYWCR